MNNAFTVYVLSPYCLLRPTTNRIFDMRMCDSFAGNGADVVIIYPYTYMKDNIRKKDIPAAFGVKNKFRTRMLFTWMREHSNKYYSFIIMMLAFGFSAIRISFERIFSKNEAIILSRDTKSLIPAIILRKLTGKLFKTRIIFAAAEVKTQRLYKWVIKNSDGVFAGVTSTKEAIQKMIPLDEKKFMISLAPVPVYEGDVSKEAARKIISYDSSKPLIVYTGKLSIENNEVVYILKSAGLLPEYNFLFTGGRQSAVEKVKGYCSENNITNCIFTGFLNDSTFIRNYQLAADILVSYYTRADHLVEFNYPQKINEYMSTGNPVITPDFPATRDVLNKDNVYFVQPENPQALAEGIKFLVENPAIAKKIAEQAKKDIQPLSFDSKAKELLHWAAGLEY